MIIDLKVIFSWFIVFILFVFIIGILKNIRLSKKQIVFWGIIITLLMSYIAYHTVPYEADDLSRYFYWIERMRGQGLEYAFEISPFSDTILSNILLYIISMTGDKQLLPSVVIFIEGMILLYIIYKEKSRQDINSRIINIYILVVVAVASIYISISGIRNNLAWFISAGVIYLDFFSLKKSKYIIVLYCFIPFIHLSASIVPMIKIISLIKIKKINSFLIAVPFIVFISQPIFSKIPLLNVIYEKIEMYKAAQFTGNSLLRTIGYFAIVLFFIIILYYFDGDKNYSDFMKKMIFFILGSYLLVPEVFFRGVTLISILSLPLIIFYIRSLKGKYSYILLSNCLLISILIFFIYEYILYYRIWNLT